MAEIVEKDAEEAWKRLVLADRENMSLQAFTQFVNQQFGRKYDSGELSSIFQNWKTGRDC